MNIQTNEVKIIDHDSSLNLIARSYFSKEEFIGRVEGKVMLSNNKFIVIVSYSNVRIRNIQTDKVTILKHDDSAFEIHSIVISFDNRFVITGAVDKKARVWKFQWCGGSALDVFDQLIK